MVKNKKTKKIFKNIGLLCIMAALLLTGFNLFQDFYYGKKASETVNEIIEVIDHQIISEEITKDELEYLNLKSIEIDNNRYVGVLEMPSIDLILPVLKDASKESLNIGPGVYVGTPYDSNFVIAAHNRITFFTKIRDLEVGDPVYFMDVYKNIFAYQVVEHDILPPENIHEMISSGYDLSLFTCDYNNTARVTVRLVKISEQYNAN